MLDFPSFTLRVQHRFPSMLMMFSPGYLVGLSGIEPASHAYQAHALPLSYRPKKNGASCRYRTCYLLHVEETLFHLS